MEHVSDPPNRRNANPSSNSRRTPNSYLDSIMSIHHVKKSKKILIEVLFIYNKLLSIAVKYESPTTQAIPALKLFWLPLDPWEDGVTVNAD